MHISDSRNRFRRFAAILLGLMLLAAAVWLLRPTPHRALILYSALDYGPELASAFTHATGVPVTMVDLSTGALLARISAEGHRPQWDLAIFDGDMAAAELDRSGLLARDWTPKGLPWNTLGRDLLSTDGSDTPLGVTLAGVFVCHRTEQECPQRVEDLLAARWRGVVGMNNPAISGPTYPLLAGVIADHGGWPAGRSFLLALKANGLQLFAKNADTLGALHAGTIQVAWVQSSAAWNEAARDASLRVIPPSQPTLLPSVMVAAKGLSSHRLDLVRQFARFTLSPQGTALRMASGPDGRFWPVTTNAVQSTLPSLAPLQAQHLDPGRWGALESRINDWFRVEIAGQ